MKTAYSKYLAIFEIIFVVGLLGYLTSRISLLGSDWYLDTDVGTWAHNAVNLLNGRPLITDDINWVYLSPMSTVFYYLTGLFFKSNPLWVFFPSFVCGLIFYLATYFNLRILFGAIPAIVALTALAIDRGVLVHQMNGLPDMMAISFFQLGLLFFLLTYKCSGVLQKVLAVLSALTFVCALLFKPTVSVCFLATTMALYLFGPKSFKTNFAILERLKRWTRIDANQRFLAFALMAAGVFVVFVLSNAAILGAIESPDFIPAKLMSLGQLEIELPQNLDHARINLITNSVVFLTSAFQDFYFGNSGNTTTFFWSYLFILLFPLKEFQGRFAVNGLGSRLSTLINLAFFVMPMVLFLPLNLVMLRRTFMFIPGTIIALAALIQFFPTAFRRSTSAEWDGFASQCLNWFAVFVLLICFCATHPNLASLGFGVGVRRIMTWLIAAPLLYYLLRELQRAIPINLAFAALGGAFVYPSLRTDLIPLSGQYASAFQENGLILAVLTAVPLMILCAKMHRKALVAFGMFALCKPILSTIELPIPTFNQLELYRREAAGLPPDCTVVGGPHYQAQFVGLFRSGLSIQNWDYRLYEVRDTNTRVVLSKPEGEIGRLNANWRKFVSSPCTLEKNALVSN